MVSTTIGNLNLALMWKTSSIKVFNPIKIKIKMPAFPFFVSKKRDQFGILAVAAAAAIEKLLSMAISFAWIYTKMADI